MAQGRGWLLGLLLVAACSTSHGAPSPGGGRDASVDARVDASPDASLGGDGPQTDATGDGAACNNCFVEAGPGVIASLAINPPVATIVVAGGMIVTQSFQATATYQGGATAPVTASWTATDAPVGGIDATGLYTPKGSQGGVVTVTASISGQQATATLTVQIAQVDDQVSGGTPAATESALRSVASALGDGEIVRTSVSLSRSMSASR